MSPDDPARTPAAGALRIYERGQRRTYSNFPDGYLPDDIEPALLSNAPIPQPGDLCIEAWMTVPLLPTHSFEQARNLHPLDLHAILDQAPPEDRWAVVVSLTEDYWEAGWKWGCLGRP
jgi:hypothetical protein